MIAMSRPPRSRSTPRSLKSIRRGHRHHGQEEAVCKAMRYEEMQTGLFPPRAVRSISELATYSSSLSLDAPRPGHGIDGNHHHQEQESVTRRRLAEFNSVPSMPLERPSTSSSSPRLRRQEQQQQNPQHDFDFDFKRDSKCDSGIAPSPSISHFTTGTTAHSPAPLVAPTEGVPTIVIVQDEDAAGPAERGTIPISTQSPTSSVHSVHSKAQNTPKRPTGLRQRLARSTSPPSAAKRMTSFHGLQAGLPVVTTDDISLEDLASNQIEFSARGSLLFGGKKMQDIIGAQGSDQAHANGVVTPLPVSPMSPPYQSTPPPVSPLDPPYRSAKKAMNSAVPSCEPLQSGGTTPIKEKRQGLVAGRRKPSIQMLQAAIHGGRVLSAEEMTFSMKVRSMYEHGDEKAAYWGLSSTGALSPATSGMDAPETFTRDIVTPEVIVHKTRSCELDGGNENWPLTENRLSYVSKYSRTSNELAGGIEDWENVDGSLVDRYGFIIQERGDSSGSSKSRPEHGMQRVASSLRLGADQPRRPRERKLQRGMSSARSSRSLPPPPKEWGFKRGPGSVHSTHSTSSSRASKNPFRSRSTRLLAEASDMLTLPPGLEDIAETDGAGKTASAQKQREWARGEKWQRMARPVKRRNEGKGGGMFFEFDTSDPKLTERTWKGIPDRWRAAAWHSFLSTSAKRRGSRTTDEELIGQFHKLQEMSCADDVQIDVDVPRTVQLHIMFRRRYRGGQRLLFRVLHAMALYFPDVGYVQGMASIAVTLLCYFDEEHAFVMMVRLWQLRGLESFFMENFSGLMAALAEFEEEWLGKGDVANKLIELGITSTTYGTRWYLTLFNMSVPFPAQLRIWDVFMLLGDAPATTTINNTTIPNSNAYGGADLDVLHATSAALVDATRDILLDSDFENAMKVLTSFVPVKDEDILMRVARAEYKMRKKRASHVKS